MKRIRFYQPDKFTLSTYPILCDTDILTGIIELNEKDLVWRVCSSNKRTLDKGKASSIEMAKKLIKAYLKLQGANFQEETRKYKI